MSNLYGEGVKFERIRRITGYLTGDLNTWGNGKLSELSDRVSHKGGVSNECELRVVPSR